MRCLCQCLHQNHLDLPSVSLTPLSVLLLLPGMGKKDDPKLMQEWFKLVQEKNALVRYESELMIL